MTTINGFIRAQGTTLVNDRGPILLKGWGIGNWLLSEGYMWVSNGNKRFDRPQRIQKVVQELVGQTFATQFWTDFRQNYFTQADLFYLKEQGYNSIRLPFHWDLFLADEPGVVFKEDGFSLLEKVFDWCKKADLYVFLDLHGAPGGQTGDNIDDSVDDLPRLFLDEDKFEKGIALWTEIAKRYHAEPVIAGFDLLNEPVKPGYPAAQEDFFVQQLVKFYQTAIKEIRQYDESHLISIEGHHWATNPLIFNQQYDANYLIHFHRYATYPEKQALQDFITLRDQLQVPLWLGETGENLLPWFSGITQWCEKEAISYHFWPYKKMGKTNCPVTVSTPQDWSLVQAYMNGGKHPGYEKAQRIFSELLENIKLANCQKNILSDYAVLRNGPHTLRATEFLKACSTRTMAQNLFNFHKDEAAEIVEVSERPEKRFAFDVAWDRFGVKLEATDQLSYAKPNYRSKKVLLFYLAVSGAIQIQNKTYQIQGNGFIEHDLSDLEEFVVQQVTGSSILTHFDFL